VKIELACSDCSYEQCFQRPTPLGARKKAKQDGWKFWRGSGWCCWPCSLDRERKAIDDGKKARLKERFHVVNKERIALINKKFLTSLSVKESRRLSKLQQELSRLDHILFPLNTDYLRWIQKETTENKKIADKISKLLNEVTR
jgi:hypothetical protein